MHSTCIREIQLNMQLVLELIDFTIKCMIEHTMWMTCGRFEASLLHQRHLPVPKQTKSSVLKLIITESGERCTPNRHHLVVSGNQWELRKMPLWPITGFVTRLVLTPEHWQLHFTVKSHVGWGYLCVIKLAGSINNNAVCIGEIVHCKICSDCMMVSSVVMM